MHGKSLISKLILVMFISASLFLVYQLKNAGMGIAQTDQDITITVINSSFAPLTTFSGNQVRVSVMYQLNNESLENVTINGIMKIFSSNGSLIHSSSFPLGFVAKERGTEDFKTTITDPASKKLIANVTLIDLDRRNTLSNTVTANLSFQESGTSSITNSTDGFTQPLPLPIPTEQAPQLDGGNGGDGGDGGDGEDGGNGEDGGD